jgi:tyrosyl-tRNA synthetase
MEELEWRGLIAGVTSRDLDVVLREPVTLYCGFDPTAPSLHVGSLLPLVVLKHFQNAGHRVIGLIGGATGQIGDPSGKNAERNLVDVEVIEANSNGIAHQIKSILGHKAKIINNLEWFKGMNLLAFLRDTGKIFSVNQMLNMESVSNRINREGEGISFTEFSYSLMQAQDFLELFRRELCTLQIGGSDQWGNICAGTELARRVENGRVFGLTIPLLTKVDGQKMGKTADGAVWLDPIATKPFHFFQFWLNQPDDQVEKLLRQLTFHTREEIAELMAHPSETRMAQKALARAVTDLVHGKDVTDAIVRASEAVFQKGPQQSSVADIEAALADAPQVEIAKATLEVGNITVVDLLVSAQLCDSKTDARRQIKQGGIRINNVVLDAEAGDRVIGPADFLEDRIMFLKKGKRSNCIVKLS